MRRFLSFVLICCLFACCSAEQKQIAVYHTSLQVFGSEAHAIVRKE